MASSSDRSFRLEELMPLIEERLAAGERVSFMPRGTSMLPMLRQGLDSVELAPLPEELRKYDLPLYRRDNGQFVLHRIVEVSGSYTCMGDNQFEREPGLRRDQMIAVVASFERAGKRIDVRDRGYRIYCRVWHLSRGLRKQLRRIRALLGKIKRRLT